MGTLGRLCKKKKKSREKKLRQKAHTSFEAGLDIRRLIALQSNVRALLVSLLSDPQRVLFKMHRARHVSASESDQDDLLLPHADLESEDIRCLAGLKTQSPLDRRLLSAAIDAGGAQDNPSLFELLRTEPSVAIENNGTQHSQQDPYSI